jgi:hypothetical protein
LGQSISIDTHEAEPPRAEVLRGLQVAQAHAEDMFNKSLAVHKTITDQMQQAVQEGKMIDASIIEKMNGAILKSKAAKELNMAVSEHNSLAEEFFKLIDAFHTNKAKMQEIQDEMDAHNEAEKANSKAEMDAAKVQMQEAAESLLQSQQKQEATAMANLLKLWNQIVDSNEKIQEKDLTMDGVVHPAIASGTMALEGWAAAEVDHVCQKYLMSKRAEVVEARSKLTETHEAEGHFFKKKSLCRGLLEDLAEGLEMDQAQERDTHGIMNND